MYKTTLSRATLNFLRYHQINGYKGVCGADWELAKALKIKSANKMPYSFNELADDWDEKGNRSELVQQFTEKTKKTFPEFVKDAILDLEVYRSDSIKKRKFCDETRLDSDMSEEERCWEGEAELAEEEQCVLSKILAEKYPAGTTVSAVAPIEFNSGTIPKNSRGTVTGIERCTVFVKWKNKGIMGCLFATDKLRIVK